MLKVENDSISEIDIELNNEWKKYYYLLTPFTIYRKVDINL